MINLQAVTSDVYRILRSVLTGLNVYNGTAPYSSSSPYAVFELVETEQREYFGTPTGDDHTLVLTVKMYMSRDDGAGALRRAAGYLVKELHLIHPALSGLAGTEIRMRIRGSITHAGMNLWTIVPVFTITGSGTGVG